MMPLILAAALAASQLGGFPDYVNGLNQAWKPDCSTASGYTVNIIVKVRFDAEGRLIGDPEVTHREGINPEAIAGAEGRILGAIKASPPVADLPDALVDEPIAIGFRASRSCDKR